MNKSFFSKVLSVVFLASFLIPVSVSLQSCGKKMKFNKSRNGGARVTSSGKVGNQKHRNNHVWGK